MSSNIRIPAVPAALIALSAAAFAQSSMPESSSGAPARPDPVPMPAAAAAAPSQSDSLALVSTLVHANVVDPSNETVAKVADLVIEPSSGGVIVVVHREEGNDLVGVPLDRLVPRYADGDPGSEAVQAAHDKRPESRRIQALALKGETELLASAPPIEAADPESLGEPGLEAVRRHWIGKGEPPAMRRAGAVDPAACPPVCANRAVGKAVKNGAGEELGEIKDFVVDLSSSRAAYAVIEAGGVIGVGAKEHGVPLAALTRGTSDGFVLDIDRETLDASPGIDLDRLPPHPSLQVSAKVSLATDGSSAQRTRR